MRRIKSIQFFPFILYTFMNFWRPPHPYHISFTHSSVDGHLGYFHFLDIVSLNYFVDDSLPSFSLFSLSGTPVNQIFMPSGLFLKSHVCFLITILCYIALLLGKIFLSLPLYSSGFFISKGFLLFWFLEYMYVNIHRHISVTVQWQYVCSWILWTLVFF